MQQSLSRGTVISDPLRQEGTGAVCRTVVVGCPRVAPGGESRSSFSPQDAEWRVGTALCLWEPLADALPPTPNDTLLPGWSLSQGSPHFEALILMDE